MVRSVLCRMIVLLTAMPLAAADMGAAMLHVNGTAWLNGSSVPEKSAILTGDMVQTNRTSGASIATAGSNVLVAPSSLVKLEANGVALEHGRIMVGTSKGIQVHVGQITISPVLSADTQFEVADEDCAVVVVAHKGDVRIAGPDGKRDLAQGQQTTVDESGQAGKKKRKCGGGAVPAAAREGILKSPAAFWTGAAIAGGITGWALTRDDNPASPWKP